MEKQHKTSFYEDSAKSLCMEGSLCLDHLHINTNFDRLQIITGEPIDNSFVHTIAGVILEVAANIGIDKGKRVRLIFEEIE